MVTFLFWNIRRNPIIRLVAKLVHDCEADVLMLAESNIPDIDLQTMLNKG